jgi:hypothetical protein
MSLYEHWIFPRILDLSMRGQEVRLSCSLTTLTHPKYGTRQRRP